jgi:rhodanese-related sulfurtransferase
MVCGIGKFSKPTTLYLKSMGYRNVRSLRGGISEWARKGRPLHPPGGSVAAT